MKRDMLLGVMAIVLGACAQLPERANDTHGAGQMIELKMIDDEILTKLHLKSDDMLLTMTNDADKPQHAILYVSKDTKEIFRAVPRDFIHDKKLEKIVNFFALGSYIVCEQDSGGGGDRWIPDPPCPLR